jgi:hypothetical protein
VYSFISGKAVVVGALVVLFGSDEITDEIDAVVFAIEVTAGSAFLHETVNMQRRSRGTKSDVSESNE